MNMSIFLLLGLGRLLENWKIKIKWKIVIKIKLVFMNIGVYIFWMKKI